MPCLQCDKPLDDESIASREHLILNALGGHKRIRGLLCVNCNNVAGARWDSELVKQLKPLALLFDVQRQDGEETPPAKFETTDGREFWLNADGSMNRAAKPFSKVPKGDGGWQIRLTPRSMEDAKKILKGIAAKYPEVDAERALASAEARFEYLDVPLIMTLDVGGELAGRAIVKSALCFAVANDVEPSACTPARAYLRDASAQAPFGYYYARDLVRNRPQQAPLHCRSEQPGYWRRPPGVCRVLRFLSYGRSSCQRLPGTRCTRLIRREPDDSRGTRARCGYLPLALGGHRVLRIRANPGRLA
jgi:hypothetical protein